MNIEITFASDALFLAPVVIPGAGAIARFDGIVRDLENGVMIAGLHYEAYVPMAEKVIREVLVSLGNEHPFQLARICHRLGFVPVGEAAILLEVHSKHRAAAFAVMTRFMDRLKQDVPIWKVGSEPCLHGPGDKPNHSDSVSLA